MPTDDDTDVPYECGRPCAPGAACDECSEYWQRMVREGYWERWQWTEKGWREIVRHA